MAKKPRKPLTPEQQARKNERQREKYRAGREAGFTRDQVRSVEKTLRNAPEILQEPTRELIGFVGSIRKFAKFLDTNAKELIEEQDKKTPKKPDPIKQGLDRLTEWLSEPIISDKKKQPKRKPKQPPTRTPDFPEYVSRNKHLSGREIKKRYRDMGGNISDRKADEIIRDVKGVEYNPNKATRKAGDRGETRPRRETIEFRTPDKNFQTKTKYMYLLGYNVKDKQGQILKRYIYIPSNRVLSEKQAIDAVMDYWEYELESGDDDKYTEVEIIPESIYLVLAYDLQKKGA